MDSPAGLRHSQPVTELRPNQPPRASTRISDKTGGLRVGSSGARFSLGPAHHCRKGLVQSAIWLPRLSFPGDLGLGMTLDPTLHVPDSPCPQTCEPRGCLSLTADVSQQNWSRADSWPWSSSVPGLPLPVSRWEISWMRGGAVPVTHPLFALVHVTSSLSSAFRAPVTSV